jgi:hypothetical protein
MCKGFAMACTQDLPELPRRIITAFSKIDCDMQQRVRAEMDCRLDFCRVTKGRTHRAFMLSGEEEQKVTIISAIEVRRCYEMCQGNMNNPALKYKRK